jgi:hypothetical protein
MLRTGLPASLPGSCLKGFKIELRVRVRVRVEMSGTASKMSVCNVHRWF